MSESDSFIREVTEEVRQDQAKRLWQRYGKLIVAVVSVVVVLTGGTVLWQRYQVSARAEAAQAFASAQTEAQANPNEAAAIYARFAEAHSGGYGDLARLYQAAAAQAQGNGDSAPQEALVQLHDAAVDSVLGDLALLYAGQMAVDTGGDLPDGFAALSAEDAPYRYSALEVEALHALNNGDEQAAIDALQRIVEALDAPPNVRLRAETLLQQIAPQAGDATGAPS